MDDKEKITKLRNVIRQFLFKIDYTHDVCRLTDMVGACLSAEVLDQANKIYKETQ